MIKPKNKFLIILAMFIVILNISLYVWNQSLKVSDVPYLVNIPVDRVAFDKQGKVWVSGDGTLSIYQDGVPIQVFTKKDSAVLVYPTWLLVIDNQGRAWVDVWNQESEKSELAVFDGTKLLAVPPIPELVLTQILQSGITEIAFDTQGRTWIGTDTQGLYIIEGKNWENYTAQNSDLLNNTVTCISFDNQGRAWIGTSGGITSTSVGINIFDGKVWQSFTTENSPQFGLRIRAIAFDLQGQAWITSNGIYTYHDGNWVRVLESDDSFVDIAVDGQGRVWAMKDFDEGIMEFNGNSWRNHDFFSTGKKFGGDLAIDGNGNIWIPTRNGVSTIISSADMISSAIASNGVIYLDILLIGIWLYFAANAWRSAGLNLADLLEYFESKKETVKYWLLIGLLVGIFSVLILVTQSYFSWPIEYLIGRLIYWIPIFGLAGLLLVGIWGLTSKIQRKYIRWASKIILGLIIAITVIWLMVVFFLTCFGIGAAGCY